MMAKAKKKTAKKKTAKKKAAKDVLCVGSKVKGYIKSNNLMCSGDLIGELSEKIYDMLDDAMDRCEANRRATVRPQDL